MSKFLLILLISLISPFVQANDNLPRILEMAVIQEETDVPFSEILKRDDWQILKKHAFAGGYSNKTHWLKLTFIAPEKQNIWLTVIMPVLDDVRLYVPKELTNPNARIQSRIENDNWRYWQQGDHFSFSERELDWRGFSFSLQTLNAVPKTIYLRVQSTSSHFVLPQLWTIRQFLAYQSKESMILGMALGTMLVFLLLATLSYAYIRESLQKSYLALIATYITYTLFINGFIIQWFPQRDPIMMSNFMGVVVGIQHYCATHFHREFLYRCVKGSIIYHLQTAMMLFSLVTSMCALFGKYHWFSEPLNTAIALMMPINFFALVWLRITGKIGTDILVIFSLLIFVTTFAITTFLGIFNLSVLDIYGVQLGALVNLTILLVVILNVTQQKIHGHKHAQAVAELQVKATQSQRYWLTMLTHEIKTPLAIIHSSCQNMSLFNLEPIIQNRIEKIKRCALQIDTLIHDFLHNDEVLLRLSHLQKLPISLNSWLEKQLQQFDEDAQTRWQLNIKTDSVIFADANLLAIALNNLLINALKYSTPKSLIQINMQLCRHNRLSGVLLSVKNDGTPIEKERQEYLFGRYQLKEYAGNGIGLWACREIARAHKGDVWLETDLRNGSNTFCIWLPKDESE